MLPEKRKRTPAVRYPPDNPERSSIAGKTQNACNKMPTIDAATTQRPISSQGRKVAPRQSMQQDHKIVVGIDFGTTGSGFSFALKGDPKDIFTFSQWPCNAIAEASRNCKTQTSLWYLPGRDGTFSLEAWGWEAQLKHNEALRARKSTLIVPKLEFSNSSPRCSPGKQSTSDIKDLGHYLTKFKLHLAPKGTYSGPNSNLGKLPEGLPLKRIIPDYFTQLSKIVVKELNHRYSGIIKKKDIRWCLTVPTMWTDARKQEMKDYAEMAGLVCGPLCPDEDASPHEIAIVLEAEAAAMFCQQKLNLLGLKKGSRFIVVDAGGGTADLVAHEKLTDYDLSVKEVTCSTGAICGGSFLDSAFWKYVERRIPGFQSLSEQHPSAFLSMKREWETIKTNFNGEHDEYYLEVPGRIGRAWESGQKANSSWSANAQYDQLVMPVKDMKCIFDGEVDKILKLTIAKRNQVPDAECIMVVGGLANSLYLIKRIRETFSRLEIYCPPDPGSAICQGAVIWGMSDDDSIRSRKSTRTYGVNATGLFKKGDPPSFAFFQNGLKLCKNQFCVYTRIGDDVPVNHAVTLSFLPPRKSAKSIELSMYSTEDREPLFVTDTGVHLVSTYTLNLPPETWTMEGEPSLEITMYFGRTTIDVFAKPLNFGNRQKQRMGTVHFDGDLL